MKAHFSVQGSGGQLSKNFGLCLFIVSPPLAQCRRNALYYAPDQSLSFSRDLILWALTRKVAFWGSSLLIGKI